MPNIAIRVRTDADFVDCVAILRDVHELSGYPVNWPADPKGWLTPPDALGYWVITVDAEGRIMSQVTTFDARPGSSTAWPTPTRTTTASTAASDRGPRRAGGWGPVR